MKTLPFCPRILRYVFPHHQQLCKVASLIVCGYSMSYLCRQGQLNPGATFSGIKHYLLGRSNMPTLFRRTVALDDFVPLRKIRRPFIRCKTFPWNIAISIQILITVIIRTIGRTCLQKKFAEFCSANASRPPTGFARPDTACMTIHLVTFNHFYSWYRPTIRYLFFNKHCDCSEQEVLPLCSWLKHCMTKASSVASYVRVDLLNHPIHDCLCLSNQNPEFFLFAFYSSTTTSVWPSVIFDQ